MKPAVSLARVGPGLEGFSEEEEVMAEACCLRQEKAMGSYSPPTADQGWEWGGGALLLSLLLTKETGFFAGRRAADRFCFPRWG